MWWWMNPMAQCDMEWNLWYNVTEKETYDTMLQGMVLDTIWEGMYIMLEFDRDCTLFNPCVTGKGHAGNVIYGTDQQGSQGVCWWKVISCFKDRICNFWIHSDSELTLKIMLVDHMKAFRLAIGLHIEAWIVYFWAVSRRWTQHWSLEGVQVLQIVYVV